MDPPILRLSIDCWSLITSLVSTADVLNFITAASTSSFAKNVANRVSSLRFEGRLHSVDLYGFLTRKHFPNALELFVSCEDPSTSMVNRPGPLHFPPKLTSLTLAFNHALDFIVHPSSVVEPLNDLKTLFISGTSACSYSIDDFRAFPNLSTLTVLTGVLLIKENDIASLPRALTVLDISTPSVPSMGRYNWPPDLTTLRLSGVSQGFAMEHLPRTLTRLHISAMVMTTSFPGAEGDPLHAFPFRPFFPFLMSLRINPMSAVNLQTTLPNIVSPHAFDSARIADFISSGCWDLPSLPYSSSHTYPLFEEIYVLAPHDVWNMSLDLFAELAPFLTKLKSFLADSSTRPIEVYQHLSSLETHSDAFMSSLTIAQAEQLPKCLKTLSTYRIQSDALKHLPQLEDLSFGLFYDQNSAQEPLTWPPHLTALSAGMSFNAPTLLSLPTALTEMRLSIASDVWNVLASHLVNLQQLSLYFSSSEYWMTSTEPLAPIQSTQLKTIRLEYNKVPDAPKGRRFLEEWLGTKSPFPPSLKDLVLIVPPKTAIPLTICPYLPRQLETLDLSSHVSVSNSNWHEEPHIASMTPNELLSQLPPCLKMLKIDNIRPNRVPIDPNVLHSLPASLVSLSLSGFIDPPDTYMSLKFLAWIAGLPPKLAAISFDRRDFVEHAYYKARRPELFYSKNAVLTD